jgi:hypothetical protein
MILFRNEWQEVLGNFNNSFLGLEKSYKIFNNPIRLFLQEEKKTALEPTKFDAGKCNKFQQVSNKDSRKRTSYSQTTQFQAQRV